MSFFDPYHVSEYTGYYSKKGQVLQKRHVDRNYPLTLKDKEKAIKVLNAYGYTVYAPGEEPDPPLPPTPPEPEVVPSGFGITYESYISSTFTLDTETQYQFSIQNILDSLYQQVGFDDFIEDYIGQDLTQCVLSVYVGSCYCSLYSSRQNGSFIITHKDVQDLEGTTTTSNRYLYITSGNYSTCNYCTYIPNSTADSNGTLSKNPTHGGYIYHSISDLGLYDILLNHGQLGDDNVELWSLSNLGSTALNVTLNIDYICVIGIKT